MSDQTEPWSGPWDEWTDGWGSFGSPATDDDEYELLLLTIFPGNESIDEEDPGTDAKLSDTTVWTFPGVTPDFGAIAAGEEFARGWCRVMDERAAWAEERARNR